LGSLKLSGDQVAMARVVVAFEAEQCDNFIV
jgi:hypothetical protein